MVWLRGLSSEDLAYEREPVSLLHVMISDEYVAFSRSTSQSAMSLRSSTACVEIRSGGLTLIGINRKQAPVHSVHTGFIPIKQAMRRRVSHWDGRLVARQVYLHFMRLVLHLLRWRPQVLPLLREQPACHLRRKCVQTCPSNTFSSTTSTSCTLCHPDCASCSGGAFNQCTACPPERPVLANGHCLSTCAKSQFLNPTSSSCQPCDPSCSGPSTTRHNVIVRHSPPHPATAPLGGRGGGGGWKWRLVRSYLGIARASASFTTLNVSPIRMDRYAYGSREIAPVEIVERSTSGAAMSDDQCAIGPDGNLLHASKISFVFDPDDPVPMPVPEEVDAGQSRPRRPRFSDKRQEAIAALQLDDDGKPVALRRPRATANSRSRKPTTTAGGLTVTTTLPKDDDDDPEDNDFIPPLVDMDNESDDEDEDRVITNAELAASLPSQLIPAASLKARIKKRRQSTKASPPKAKRVREESSVASVVSMASSVGISTTAKGGKRSHIYRFFEQVDNDANGESAEGMEYFKIIQLALYNIPMIYRFYEAIKTRKDALTAEELKIATAQTPLDEEAIAKYISGLEPGSMSIMSAFQHQLDISKPTWDQGIFEQLLVEWMVCCDQPFMEVEWPEFRKLIQYVYQRGGSTTPIHVPGRTTIQTKVMKAGNNTIAQIRQMFENLESDITISLDAWTSPNQYAFLAIVAHYITNDGKLGDTELIGQHSGENMADAVWETLNRYGLIGRVTAFMMDNASNNDTLICELEDRLKDAGAISGKESERAVGRSGQYQMTVTSKTTTEYDDDAVFMEDEDTFDESSYCTWASLLDPRIAYKGLKEDYKDDETLLSGLEKSKATLRAHFNEFYRAPPAPDPSTTTTLQSISPADYDFMARYEIKDRVSVDELEEFWNLPREDIRTCDPIQWWYSRRHHFPSLYRLARNLLAIPGSAVAVERIFSGARDTISLRRASLKPQTIEILMLLKHRLRLARTSTVQSHK
ncbi:hypothetical protein CCMSSC00406_0009198 [Pleurotus cornucopiae]|uniref:Uncharacterized protein n=1 Tax=Pleurotus cornucopiae TaxID=5321 RepID=A0ACB7IV39_PLECO|nr:hypothetical protein CCMSSC00406_0009198 [Pleurotus cornucopiae]